jgi:hypothetical protein
MSKQEAAKQEKTPKAPSNSSSLGPLAIVAALVVLGAAVFAATRFLGTTTQEAVPAKPATAPKAVTVSSSDSSQAFRIALQSSNVATGEIVFGNALPDGSYPNVTGRYQILDYGVQRPRTADGTIPFEIRGRVPVEEWLPTRSVAQPNIDRATPLIMRGSVVSKWAAQGKWSPEYFRNHVPVWKHITRGKCLRRSFINFEYGTPYDECTPW